MQLKIDILQDGKGKRICQATLRADDGTSSFTFTLDGASCRASGAALERAADEIDKRITAPTRRRACGACEGLLLSFARIPELKNGVWVHKSIAGDNAAVACSVPPAMMPPGLGV
jgi:hypothetical protein